MCTIAIDNGSYRNTVWHRGHALSTICIYQCANAAVVSKQIHNKQVA